MSRNRVFVLLLLGNILGLVVGCGSGVYPAGGKVVFPNGEPLRGGIVFCEKSDGAERHRHSVRGFIQSDGTFRLGTFKDDDGAPEGKYRVKIQPPEKMVIDETKPTPASIQQRFTQFESSKLEIIVTRSREKNQFTLTVEKP